MYASYLHRLFLFNIQRTNEYKWQDLHDKTSLQSLAAFLMPLVVKTILLQIKKCILSPFQR